RKPHIIVMRSGIGTVKILLAAELTTPVCLSGRVPVALYISQRHITVDLIPPRTPPRPPPSGEQLHIRPRPTPFDDHVLLFRLMTMFLHRRVEPCPLSPEQNRRIAPSAKQDMLGLVAQVHAQSEPRLDPRQDAPVRKPPRLQHIPAGMNRSVGYPQPA